MTKPLTQTEPNTIYKLAAGKFLTVLLAALGGSFVTSVFAQQADVLKLSRQAMQQNEELHEELAEQTRKHLPRVVAPGVYRVYGPHDPLPEVLVVPPNESPPRYRLERLAAFTRCQLGQHEPECLEDYLTGIKAEIVKKTRLSKLHALEERYRIELKDGRRFDSWKTTSLGKSLPLPDGSSIRAFSLETEVIRDFITPWDERLDRLVFGPRLVGGGGLTYFARVSANDEVLWAYAYLMRITDVVSSNKDQSGTGGDIPQRSLISLNHAIFPKNSGSALLITDLTSYADVGIHQPSRKVMPFTQLNRIALEIDLETGRPKTIPPSVRVVAIDEVSELFHKVLNELIGQGVMTSGNTPLTRFNEDHDGNSGKFWYSEVTDFQNEEFTDRVVKSLIDTYFNPRKTNSTSESGVSK